MIVRGCVQMMRTDDIRAELHVIAIVGEEGDVGEHDAAALPQSWG